MLQATNLQITYDGVIEAIRDVSFTVPEGTVVTLLGANGAGKSTLLKALSGILYAEDGDLINGTIEFGGKRLNGWSADRIVRAGVVQVPEGRRLFQTLTLEENLLMGAFTRGAADRKRGLELVFDLFPDLGTHARRIAGYLSGGQQQMVAIGRALISEPKLLMLDEPSLGLAPKIIEAIFNVIGRLKTEHKLSILLVEQNAELALSIADYGYVLDRGRVVLDGSAQRLLANPEVRDYYLGAGESGARRSMRDVKHYRRRKRWLS